MLFLVIFFAVLFPVEEAGESVKSRVSLNQESFLVINGSSNINNFSCSYAFEEYDSDYSFSASYDGISYYLNSLTINIPVNQFDCGNRFLKKDFLKTLEYQRYPNIFMQLQNLKLGNTPEDEKRNSSVHLNIGGVSREQMVNYQLKTIDDKTFILEGVTKVDITDFELEPVSRFFGMIKVDKNVEIRFLFKFVVE